MKEVPVAMTLLEFNTMVASLVQVGKTSGIWVTGEISECRVRGGHCYLELVEKDQSGTTVARSRAIVWASNYYSLQTLFTSVAGQPFDTGMKVMVNVTASFHASFGFSLIINDINPEFTVGDMIRRRREILERLTAEGTIDMNRSIEWNRPSNRIAVVSSGGAAGYGDFVNQLFTSRANLRFSVKLFPAIMQGAKAAGSIIAALEDIVAEMENFDCVVIIRGGGATDELSCFDDYALADNVAQFPLPVLVGIGHERDVTVLDFVASKRVKTPTAAAEWFLAEQQGLLDALDSLSDRIVSEASSRVDGEFNRLERLESLIPSAVRIVLDRSRSRISLSAATLSSAVVSRLNKPKNDLEILRRELLGAIPRVMTGAESRLDSLSRLLEALSPSSILNRGFSITRLNGHVVRSVENISKGDMVETIVADGKFNSKIS